MTEPNAFGRPIDWTEGSDKCARPIRAAVRDDRIRSVCAILAERNYLLHNGLLVPLVKYPAFVMSVRAVTEVWDREIMPDVANFVADGTRESFIPLASRLVDEGLGGGS